ncbi:MAG: hypothetical protein H7Z72_23085 [Bacteroidetes bacterium]|nr:hypothetical protein [Fibrella sp.]
MTEPNNDRALHESVRQRLSDYRPPFDPDNWQRMRRKLRRDRWRLVAWCLTAFLVLVSIGWYAGNWSPPSPERLKLTAASPKSTGVTVAKSAPILDGVTKSVRSGRLLDKAKNVPTAQATDYSERIAAVLPIQLRSSLPSLTVFTPSLPPVIVHSPDEPDIIRRVMTGTIGSDSTTYRVLARNLTRWPNAVVVCDFTSSMYRYSTQLMAWFERNKTSKQVQGIVFFTDCDSLGRETQPGQSGQLFVTRGRTVQDVLPLMLASARNTMGNVADAENNIDPLVHAQRQFPEADHLILIADNSSTVKDMARLPELRTPVHIILCGPTQDTARAFQPDYHAIARQTGGSLHTLEDDLTNVSQLRPNTWIRIDRRYYRLNRRGRFMASDFRHRPRRVLGLFWQ